MAHTRILPERLKPGARIALVSPSDPAAGLYPDRLRRAITVFSEWGYSLVPMAHARAVHPQLGYLAGTDEERAEDLMQAFDDPQIDGIWASIGGLNSNRILDRLDYDRIRQHPKVFVGYSDCTALLNAITAETGLVTFHGPNALVELAVAGDVMDYTKTACLALLTEPTPRGRLTPPPESWLIDWPAVAPGTRISATPWRGNQKGAASGPLVGGNLQTLMKLAGSRYWPDFRGSILVVEDVGVPLHHLDGHLTALRGLGVLDAVAGLVIGRINANGQETLPADDVLTMVADVLDHRDLPVLVDVDFGHTDPMLTLPIGGMAAIDATEPSLALMEGVVR